MYNQILANHYAGVDWQKQLLIFGRIIADRVQQFSTTPIRTTWEKTNQAAYVSPCTYHRLYHHRNNVIDSARIDHIPCIFVDVDYHRDPERKPYWGQIFVDLLDTGLVPTLMLETPRGYHLFYYLKENIVMRWSETTTGWQPRPEASRAAAWWRELSFALHRRIIAAGYPADTTGAGSAARLMRRPTDANVRHYDEKQTYTLTMLNDHLEGWKLNRIISSPTFRKIYAADWEGVGEGYRNTAGTGIARALVCEYGKTPERGLRHLLEWAARCTPPYPEKETIYIWKSVYQKWLRGELNFTLRTNERSRKEQGPYAARKYRSKTDEAISAAVAKMQAAGVADPWQHTRALAREAGITHTTIINRKKDFFSE